MFGKLAATAALVVAAGPASAQTQTIVDTQKTMADQPLVAPDGPLEVIATSSALPAGAVIDTHMHFWPRYVYVLSGQVEVTLLDSGLKKRFNTGSMIVEPIGKWHSGRVIQDSVLLSVEQVPPGRCNTVKPPSPAGAKGPAKTNDC